MSSYHMNYTIHFIELRDNQKCEERNEGKPMDKAVVCSSVRDPGVEKIQ